MSLLEGALASGNEVTEAVALLLNLRGYLGGTEARQFFHHIAQQPYTTDTEVQEAVVNWFARIPVTHSAQIAETLRAIEASLASIAEKNPTKYPASFDEAVVELILALGYWLLSGKENAIATGAFWRGLKTLLRTASSDSVSPMIRAFEILEPLLLEVNPDLVHSAVGAGRSDADPFVRAFFVVLRGFGGTT